MKRRNKVIRGCAVLLALMLAGCGMFDKKQPPPCPPISVLADAGDLVRYKPGPGRDITDVVFEAKISNFRGSCSYRDKNTKVSIDLAVMIDLKRGPADRDGKAAFEYFVAIPKFHPAPEGKRVLPIQVEFVRNRTRLRVTDALELDIPIANGGKGDNYPVFIGFQLSPEELRENRARRGN